VGAAAYKADLNNTISICKALKHPEKKFLSIHVAGTNGKGSTSHLLASIFQEAGYKTGLYTSPHLKDFRERIKINGKKVSKSYITRFVEKYFELFQQIQPSFFEMTVGLAFNYFSDQKVDIAIIETGLGGRLDSTNVITPLVSVITNISMDHASLLGDTLDKIANEKGGIIKTKIPVIIGEKQVSICEVFNRIAKDKEAPIYYADEAFSLIKKSEKSLYQTLLIQINKSELVLKCELKGAYQYKNILTVLQTVELLKQQFDLPEHCIKEGIKKVITNTELSGRWQILSKSPLTICDTGHNEAGIKEVLKQIKETKFKKLHFVLGLVNDKDVDSILTLLPKKATYYFCKAKIPRALHELELQAKANSFGLLGASYKTVNKALVAAKDNAKNDDLIFIGGSTFVVAEVV
jgi:dihydrofolate synthase / folylpolyglutamate synthase